MKRFIYPGMIILLIFFIGCAGTSQFKKSEKVTLMLHDGNKIKCYVTHVGSNQLFFQATRATDAYNYGDMLNIGQIKKIRLANDAEMSVAEYQEYRQKAQSASTSQMKVQPEMLTFDALYEKLKHKEIDKMSDKEFQYFLMMKEQENLAYQKKLEMSEKQRQAAEIQELSHELRALKQKAETTSKRSSVRSVPAAETVPKSSSKSPDAGAFLKLLARTDMTGAFLFRISNMEARGRILSPKEKSLVAQIKNSPHWKKQRLEILEASEQAAKALEEAFLMKPDALQTELGLVFGPEELFDFNALMQQFHRNTGANISMSYYRKLAQILGEDGGRAMRTLLVHFEAWQYISAHNR